MQKHKGIFIKILYLIFCIVISSSLFANDIPSHLETAPSLKCNGLKNYKIIILTAYDYSSLVDKYYITKPFNGSNYDILDSIETRFVCAGDTNVIIHESMDDSFSYLIAITLSPKIQYDTLITFENRDHQNWISKIDNFLWFSIKDSVLMYYYHDPMNSINSGCKIIKILPQNKWKEVTSIRNFGNACMLWDFSKFYICTDYSIRPDDFPPGRLFVYDIALDSLYERKDLGSGILNIERRYEHLNLYYLQCFREECNVWKLTPEGKKIQLTNLKFPYYVRYFGLSGEDLDYTVKHRHNRDYEKTYWIKIED